MSSILTATLFVLAMQPHPATATQPTDTTSYIVCERQRQPANAQREQAGSESHDFLQTRPENEIKPETVPAAAEQAAQQGTEAEPKKTSGGWIIDKDHCTISKDGRTLRLYGKVKIVDNFQDLKVKIVDDFEDAKIKVVDNFENSCGRVRVVDNFEDVRVKIVDNYEDLKVKLVDNFEGFK